MSGVLLNPSSPLFDFHWPNIFIKRHIGYDFTRLGFKLPRYHKRGQELSGSFTCDITCCDFSGISSCLLLLWVSVHRLSNWVMLEAHMRRRFAILTYPLLGFLCERGVRMTRDGLSDGQHASPV